MNRIRLVFFRYILLFFLFACVLVLLFIPVYQYISRTTLEGELDKSNNYLKKGVIAFDSAIRAINSTALFTGADSRFRVLKYNPKSVVDDPVLLKELQKTLNNYCFLQPLIADAGIIFSEDAILSRQRIFLKSDFYPFYGEYLKCGDLTYNEWKNLLVSARPLLPLMEYQSKDFISYDALTYIIQWYSTDEPGQNIMYATLPLKNIVPLVIENESIEKFSLQINDNSGNSILEYSGNSHASTEKQYVLSVQSETIPISFKVSIPEAEINIKMRPVRNMILVFALISAGFIILISLFFAYKGSEPMRRLLANISAAKNVKLENTDVHKNEKRGIFKNLNSTYRDLEESINDVDAKLENTLRTIEQQTQLLREQAFDRALRHGIYGDAEQKEFLSMFPDFPNQYQLALIRYVIPAAIPVREAAAFQLNMINIIRIWDNKIITHAMEENTIVMLLPLSGQNEYWYKRLETLRDNLYSDMDYSLHISLSDFFGKPQELARAWRQLQFIHNRFGTDDLVSVQRIKNITADYDRLPVNIGMPQMIYNALCNGNESTACAILDECVRGLDCDAALLILVFNMIHDMIVLLKLENPELLSDVEIPRYEDGNEGDFLLKQLSGCFRLIAQRIRSSKEDGINNMARKVMDYINENLYNRELYSTMIMDHFNISHPTMQKLIKIATGMSYQVYVESRRLDRAMQMLSEGGRTINEVSAGCGFSKTDSFYKAFKRTYGFPPSDILHA